MAYKPSVLIDSIRLTCPPLHSNNHAQKAYGDVLVWFLYCSEQIMSKRKKKKTLRTVWKRH